MYTYLPVGIVALLILNRVVLESANPQGRAIIALLLFTGIRTSQLGEIKWDEVKVSREQGWMAVYRQTIADYVEIPLNRLVREALLNLDMRRTMDRLEQLKRLFPQSWAKNAIDFKISSPILVSRPSDKTP